MGSMGRSAALALTIGAIAMVAASARAQAGMGEAESHFVDGERYYEAGDYDSAIAAFQRAYDLLAQNPERYQVLFNIARCQEALFRYDEAMASYEAFLVAGPNHERAPEARRRVQALSQMLGQLQITTNAPRADVWLNDRRVGTAPGLVRVASGRHVVELRARGFAPTRQDVVVAARTVVPVSFSMDRAFAGVSPAFFIAGGVLTLGAAAVGLGFGGVAFGERQTIDGRLASTDPRERYQVTQAQIDAMEQNALIADVMLGVAGGLAIATVILLFVTDWGAETAVSANAALTVAPIVSSDQLGIAIGAAL